MPFYEYQCTTCGARDELFVRRVLENVPPPPCPKDQKHEMRRIVSAFSRHLTAADQLAEAEAKWGKEVEAAMGPEPDIGKYARRYESLSKGLPSENDL